MKKASKFYFEIYSKMIQKNFIASEISLALKCDYWAHMYEIVCVVTIETVTKSWIVDIECVITVGDYEISSYTPSN